MPFESIASADSATAASHLILVLLPGGVMSQRLRGVISQRAGQVFRRSRSCLTRERGRRASRALQACAALAEERTALAGLSTSTFQPCEKPRIAKKISSSWTGTIANVRAPSRLAFRAVASK